MRKKPELIETSAHTDKLFNYLKKELQPIKFYKFLELYSEYVLSAAAKKEGRSAAFFNRIYDDIVKVNRKVLEQAEK